MAELSLSDVRETTAGCGREDETAVAGAAETPKTPRCCAEDNRDCNTRAATVSTGMTETFGADELDAVVVAEGS